MLYFCVRKVQFTLSIELKKNTSFGLLHLSHWRLDLFCSWKMEWSHGKVMEKSLNFIPNFQYEPWEKVFSKMKTPRVLQEKDLFSSQGMFAKRYSILAVFILFGAKCDNYLT